MSDYELPDLPSDEELGIAGLSEDDFKDPPAPPSGSPPSEGGEPPAPPKPPAKSTAAAPSGPPWRGWVTLGVLLLGAFLSSSYRSIPSPQAANAPDSVFASGRALSTLVELAQAPHPTGSPEHERVRRLVVSRLEGLGLQPEIQEETYVLEGRAVPGLGQTPGRARAATIRNVLARIPGSDPTGAVLLTAHYDAVPQSLGAGDDGTGVVAILEATRALLRGPQLRNDLILLITDAEELGLLGAHAFVDGHPWMADVRMVLSVEMRGVSGPSIMFETGRENGWVIRELAAHDPAPLATSVSVEVYRRLPNDTDFSPFRDAGIQGLNFSAIGGARHYHQTGDAPENLSEATLQHHGDRLLAMARALGNADLTAVQAPDRAYLSLPLIGLVHLPVSRIWLVSLGLLVALVLLTFLASLRGARSRGFLLAAVLSVVSVGLTAGAGWAMLRWFLPVHAEYPATFMVPALHVEAPSWTALTAAALAITLTLFTLGHRWMAPLEAMLGALLLPLLALLALTFTAPAAAFSIQIPLAAVVLLLATLTALGLQRAQGNVAWAVSLMLALPVLAVMVPLVELTAVALTFRSAPVLGALLGFFLLLLLPALAGLERPNRWWAPALSVAVALIALGVGWLQRGADASSPAPSTLVYAMERGDGASPGSAAWLTRDGPGLAWAQDAVGSLFPDEAMNVEDLELSSWGGGYRGVAAPVAAVPGPRLALRADTVVGGERRVRLALRSEVGAERMFIRLSDDVAPAWIWGAGIPRAPSQGLVDASVRVLDHWGRPAGELEFELTGRAGSDWDLEVVEHHLRPGEIFGPERFQRPPELRANAPAQSDRAVFRSLFRLDARGNLLARSSPGPLVPSGPGEATEAPAPADTTLYVDSVPSGDSLLSDDSLAAGRDTVPDSLAAGDTVPDTTSGSGPAPDTASVPGDSADAAISPPDTAAPDTTGSKEHDR